MLEKSLRLQNWNQNRKFDSIIEPRNLIGIIMGCYEFPFPITIPLNNWSRASRSRFLFQAKRFPFCRCFGIIKVNRAWDSKWVQFFSFWMLINQMWSEKCNFLFLNNLYDPLFLVYLKYLLWVMKNLPACKSSALQGRMDVNLTF